MRIHNIILCYEFILVDCSNTLYNVWFDKAECKLFKLITIIRKTPFKIHVQSTYKLLPWTFYLMQDIVFISWSLFVVIMMLTWQYVST